MCNWPACKANISVHGLVAHDATMYMYYSCVPNGLNGAQLEWPNMHITLASR